MVNSMGRTSAEQVPAEIRDLAHELGYSGVNTYSMSIGLSEQRLYQFFGSSHRKLKPYYLLATFCNITVDELLVIIKDGKFAPYIEKVKKRHAKDGITSTSKLEKACRVGEGFIQNIMQGRVPNYSITEWNEVAERLGWSVHKLAESTLK